jgi:hypothetical protein
MRTFNEFLAKLDKLNFVKLSTSDKSIISEEGFEVSYRAELHYDGFQIVIRVTYNDVHVQTWGCEDAQQQDEFGVWFLGKKRAIEDIEYAKTEKTKAIGKSILEHL